MGWIFIHDMQFYGYHGVYVEETKLGQRFTVSVDLQCDMRLAAQHDDLTLTVNYAEVYNVVKAVMEGDPYQLLEAVAEHVASSLLQRFNMIHTVRVRLEKPNAPIAGIFAVAGVEIERTVG